jgi:hypothetical protein
MVKRNICGKDDDRFTTCANKTHDFALYLKLCLPPLIEGVASMCGLMGMWAWSKRLSSKASMLFEAFMAGYLEE